MLRIITVMKYLFPRNMKLMHVLFFQLRFDKIHRAVFQSPKANL